VKACCLQVSAAVVPPGAKRPAGDFQIAARIVRVGAGQVFLQIRQAVAVGIGAGVDVGRAEIRQQPGNRRPLGASWPCWRVSACTWAMALLKEIQPQLALQAETAEFAREQNPPWGAPVLSKLIQPMFSPQA